MVGKLFERIEHGKKKHRDVRSRESVPDKGAGFID